MTTFPEAIRLGFVNYVNFRGESTRREYWFWILFVFIVSSIAGLIDYGISLAVGGNRYTDGASVSIFSTIVGLGLLLPNLSATVRRLRDAGKHWANIFWGIGGSIIGNTLIGVAFAVGVLGAVAGFGALYGGSGSVGAAAGGLLLLAIILGVLGLAISLTGIIILIVKLCAPSVLPQQAVAASGNYSYYG